MFLSALLLFGTSFLPISLSSERCEPATCPEGFNYNLVASYTASEGQLFNIFECATESVIRFYRIELSKFKPFDIVKLDSIDTILKRPLTIEVDECGEVVVTIYPTHPKRSFVTIDFSFLWNHMRIDMGVSKYLQRPEDLAHQKPQNGIQKERSIVIDQRHTTTL